MTEPTPDQPNHPVNPTDAETPALWRPRRLLVQILGFLVGGALLWWCIAGAAEAGNWDRLREANPWLIAGMIGCSLLSLAVNGFVFWLVVRPIQDLGAGSMLKLNCVTAVLNYAPIRLGLIARMAYHLVVDRMPLLRMMAMFASVAYTMLMCLSLAILSVVLRPSFDWIWALMLIGMLLVAGFMTMGMTSHPLIVKHGRGMHLMLRDPSALWSAIILRMVDIAAFAGRMACAVAILGLDLSTADVLLLGFAALAMTLNPLGRFGFREAGVAVVAGMLTSDSFDATNLDGTLQQLSLIESAGEAIVAIPLGALCLLWYRSRWRKARATAAVVAENEDRMPG